MIGRIRVIERPVDRQFAGLLSAFSRRSSAGLSPKDWDIRPTVKWAGLPHLACMTSLTVAEMPGAVSYWAKHRAFQLGHAGLFALVVIEGGTAQAPVENVALPFAVGENLGYE